MPTKVNDHDYVYVLLRVGDGGPDRTPDDAEKIARVFIRPKERDEGAYEVDAPEVYDTEIGPEYQVRYIHPADRK
jgi:hypothetical protein